MELEFFCKPGTELEWHKFYKDYCYNYLLSLGINKDKLRLRDHSKEELCFIVMLLLILNIYSHLAGENYGELLQELIMI